MDTTVTPTSHWKCQCGQEGSGFIPESCPTCEDYLDATLTQKGWKATLRAHQLLDDRTRHIADLLDYGHESFDYTYADREGGTITAKWETYCGRGCCSPESHSEDFPARYLWMADEDILAEEKAKKEAIQKAEAEKKRKAESAQAEQELARAKARALTAQADAAAALAKAEAIAQALRGAP